ncbi:GAF domain-containing protein [Streptomyces monomycini]|uniref:GAF domain-containing protein n=1 Tax=Streptomyces monomycini TaxID=371720 RepID=UPI00067CABAC|nr:GAF domain-containing protein [Streptomyces monomycini]
MEGSEANVCRFRRRLADLSGGPLRARAEVTGFLDTLTRVCAELLEAAGCGMLLTDDTGSLNLVSASTEPARHLQHLQLSRSEGPWVDSFHTGHGTQCPNLAHARTWWPSFAPAAQEAGFRSVQTSAMRLRGETIGTIGVYRTEPGPSEETATVLAQALADVAAAAVRRHRLLSCGAAPGRGPSRPSGPFGTEPRAASAGHGSGDPSGLPPGRRRRVPRADPSQEYFDA